MLMHALCLAIISAPPKVEVRAAPIFLVLKTATTAAQQAREARLHDEVSLLLDTFAVLSQPVDDAAFAGRTLAQQLKQALELASLNEAVGVLWLAEPSAGQLMVHVVGIGTGRSLIRTLEFDQRSGSERALALIVRELLGTAFLQAAPEAIDPSLADVVRKVRRQLPKDARLEAPVEAPMPPAPPPVKRLSASVAVVSTVALGGGSGRWATLGAQLRGELGVGERAGPLHLGLELELLGARDFGVTALVSTLEVPVGLTASLHLNVGAFTVVPRVSVLGAFNQVWVRDPAGLMTSALLGSMRARAGVGVRSTFAAPVQLMVELSADAVPVRAAVRNEVTGADLWRSPWLELRLGAGVSWEG